MFKLCTFESEFYIVFFLQSCVFERFEFLKECVMMEGGRCDFLGMQLEKAGGVHWLAGGGFGQLPSTWRI